MFDEINQQNLADMIKAHLLRTPTPQERQTALNTLRGFEQARWVPRFFDQAAQEIAPNRLRLADRKLNHNGRAGEARRDLVQIMQRYLELLAANTPQPKTSERMEGAR